MSKINDNFIFFGCWNQGQCDITKPNLNGLSSVMSKLSIEAETNGSPKFYVVAGDNYYPQKNKDKTKDKIFNKDQLDSGFKCLEHLLDLSKQESQIYILMGNHDLQYENNLINSKDEKIENHCIILEEELKYKDQFHFNKRSRLFENTLLLFTTSMLFTNDFLPDIKKDKKIKDKESSKKEESTKELATQEPTTKQEEKTKEKTEDKEKAKGGSPELDCINLFQNETLKEINLRVNKPNELTLSDIKWDSQDIIDLINNEIKHLMTLANSYSLNKKIKNIAICGHDPIISIKEKESKKKGTMLNDIGIKLFNQIYDLFPNANKFYLCADIHHFQEGIIQLGNHKIQQFVVGTGGTACDDLCIKNLPFTYNFPNTEDDEEFILENRSPDLIREFTIINCIYKQGYLICQENSDQELRPRFQDTHDCFSKPNFSNIESKQKGGTRKKRHRKNFKKDKKSKKKKNYKQ